MSSDILHEYSWTLSSAERVNPEWIECDHAPRAGEVLYEFGLKLGIPLAMALVVNVCLWVAGIPSP